MAVAVAAALPGRADDASALARTLRVPLVTADDRSHALLLVLTSTQLELHETDSRAGPIVVEFERGAFGQRRSATLRREAVVRAVGYRGDPLDVVDMTAGLGRDAVVLAAAGCHVTAVERHPVVHALLADGLARARRDAELDAIITERLTLVRGDAVAYLRERPTPPDVVYLDPMFPERSGSAVPKKGMRILARLVGHDDDADRLFAPALASGARRVVVKRPRLAPPLGGPLAPSPTMRIEGRSSRFDIYVIPDARRPVA